VAEVPADPPDADIDKNIKEFVDSAKKLELLLIQSETAPVASLQQVRCLRVSPRQRLMSGQ